MHHTEYRLLICTAKKMISCGFNIVVCTPQGIQAQLSVKPKGLQIVYFIFLIGTVELFIMYVLTAKVATFSSLGWTMLTVAFCCIILLATAGSIKGPCPRFGCCLSRLLFPVPAAWLENKESSRAPTVPHSLLSSWAKPPHTRDSIKIKTKLSKTYGLLTSIIAGRRNLCKPILSEKYRYPAKKPEAPEVMLWMPSLKRSCRQRA